MAHQSVKHCDHSQAISKQRKTLASNWLLEIVGSFPERPAFGDDKVSVLTRTYKHKPLRKAKWLSAITILIAPVWPDV